MSLPPKSVACAPPLPFEPLQRPVDAQSLSGVLAPFARGLLRRCRGWEEPFIIESRCAARALLED